MNYFIPTLLASLALDIHPSGGLFVMAFITTLTIIENPRMLLKMLLGMCIGCAWWFGIRFAFNTPQFFMDQMRFNRIYGQVGSPFEMLMGEWGRWRDFFWGGYLHRNMFWFALMLIGLLKSPAILLKLIVLGFLSMAIVPAKGTVYIIYIWPLIIISIMGIFKRKELSPV